MIFNSRYLLIALVLMQPQAASALSIVDAYNLALQNDAAYQSAVFENEAGQQYKVLGHSNLLPVVSANYAYNKNKAEIEFQNTAGSRTEDRDYNSKVAAIQVRQPLVNFEGMARNRLGVAQTLLSDQQLAMRKQELIVRLFNKYASALYSEDLLALSIAQRDAYAEQKNSNEFMFKKGEGTKTDAIESQAKFDLAEAEVIEAQDALANERDAMAKIVGQEVTALDPLLPDFKVQFMHPARFEEWKNIAEQQNPEIIAQRYSLDIAREDVNRNRAGHMPRLDAVASINQNESDTTNSFNQKATTKSIGLQLTVPIYAGGSVSASTSQAQSNLQKAQAELDKKSNEVMVELRKQYNTAHSSSHRVDALNTSVKSAQLLIEATKKSVKGGTRTNLDVLNAERQMYEAKRDLALARYNYLQSYLNLRKAAGTVSLSDLQVVAAYFGH